MRHHNTSAIRGTTIQRRDTGRVTPAPPSIPGLRSPRLRDLSAYVTWTARGCWHQARRASTIGEAAAMTGLGLFETLGWPAHVASIGIVTVIHRRTSRTYMSPERDGWVTVQATRYGWKVIEHVDCRVGRRTAAPARGRPHPAAVRRRAPHHGHGDRDQPAHRRAVCGRPAGAADRPPTRVLVPPAWQPS